MYLFKFNSLLPIMMKVTHQSTRGSGNYV